MTRQTEQGDREIREELDDEDICYICLDGPRPDEPLVHPCSCPRTVHAHCLAKWQLNCAGKDEETRCRFCNNVLPDWRPALTPTSLQPTSSVMSVRYRGVTHRITYTPGPDGLQHFLETLQGIGIKVASASQVTFLCRSPDTGEEMSLKGLKAFDAAAYCASITAAKRAVRDADKRQRRRLVQQQHQQRQMQQQQQQQQHESDTSPHQDHHSADMGVRPEAGPDSPHAHHCNRQVAYVHAEAGGVSDLQQQHRHLHSTAHPHGFLHSLLHSSAHSSPGHAHEDEHAAGDDHDAWWRRALTRMHIHVQEGGRRSA